MIFCKYFHPTIIYFIVKIIFLHSGTSDFGAAVIAEYEAQGGVWIGGFGGIEAPWVTGFQQC